MPKRGGKRLKLDFDTENIRRNEINLLDSQVDLLLRSLEFYAYTYRYIYPRSNKSFSKEENLRISLVTDTYNQILRQYKFSNSRATEKFFKNISKIS